MPQIRLPDGSVAYAPDINQIIGDYQMGGVVGPTQSAWANIQADPRALNALRQEALRAPGEASPWTQMSLQRIENQRTGGRDQALQDAMAQAGNQRAQMAMRGGITGGAGERLGKTALQSAFQGQQAVNRQAQDQGLQVQQQAEQQRVGLLSAQPGQELAALGPQMQAAQQAQQAREFEQQQYLTQQGVKYAGAMAPYQEQMKAYAAAMQGNAIRNADSGKK